MVQTIQLQPLSIENFAPFGEVICCGGQDFFHINDAHTERYHALVTTEIFGEAHAGISIFRNIKQTEIPFFGFRCLSDIRMAHKLLSRCKVRLF